MNGRGAAVSSFSLPEVAMLIVVFGLGGFSVGSSHEHALDQKDCDAQIAQVRADVIGQPVDYKDLHDGDYAVRAVVHTAYAEQPLVVLARIVPNGDIDYLVRNVPEVLLTPDYVEGGKTFKKNSWEYQ